MKPIAFIHIPKTAGTSIANLFQKYYDKDFRSDSALLGRRNPNYLTSESFEDNIFDVEFLRLPTIAFWEYWNNNIIDKNINKFINLHFDTIDYTVPVPNDLCENDNYKKLNWLTMLRDPVERVISEYYFLNLTYQNGHIVFKTNKYFWVNRNHMINKEGLQADDMPDIVDKYVNMSQTFNGQTKWLMGKDYLCTHDITEEEFNLLINKLDSLDIKVGIVEHMLSSINYFNKSLNLNLNYYELSNLRKNIEKLPVTDRVRELIKKNNKWDIKLYNYYLNKLKSNI